MPETYEAMSRRERGVIFNAVVFGEPNVAQVTRGLTYRLAVEVGEDAPVRLEVCFEVVEQGEASTQAEFSDDRCSDVGMQDLKQCVVVQGYDFVGVQH